MPRIYEEVWSSNESCCHLISIMSGLKINFYKSVAKNTVDATIFSKIVTRTQNNAT